MSKKYRSDASAAIHETMQALHNVGAIDKQTMRRFDEACLTPVQPLSPNQIKALREREHVSQTVFANYLNVTPNLVSKWERGEKKPSGPALKLLSLVEKRGIQAVAYDSQNLTEHGHHPPPAYPPPIHAPSKNRSANAASRASIS